MGNLGVLLFVPLIYYAESKYGINGRSSGENVEYMLTISSGIPSIGKNAKVVFYTLLQFVRCLYKFRIPNPKCCICHHADEWKKTALNFYSIKKQR